MGIRKRKQTLILALKGKALGGSLDEQQVEAFSLMYGRAKTEAEQDQVTKALEDVLHGWKTGSDAYSRLRQAENGSDPLGDDDEDEDPPALKAALARAQVTFLR